MSFQTILKNGVVQLQRKGMNAAVDGVLTLARAMCASVKTIGASGVNPGSAQQNSPLLDDKKTFFCFFFF